MIESNDEHKKMKYRVSDGALTIIMILLIITVAALVWLLPWTAKDIKELVP